MINAVIQNRVGGASTETVVQNSLAVDGQNPVNISLNLNPSDIASYQAQGSDLVLTLVNGETITLVDFYDVDGPLRNRLFLSENGEIVEAALPPSAERAALDGLVGEIAVTPQNAPLVFDGNSVLAVAAGAGELSAGALAAGAGLGLLALAAAASGGGGDDDDGDGDPGTVVASPDLSQSAGAILSGTSIPGNQIEVDIDGDGVADFETTVDDDGNWEIRPNPGIPNGTEIAVTSVAPDGSRSAPTEITVDSDAPIAPQVNPTNGATVSGTGEPGAQINIDTDGDGTPDATATVGEDGTWTADISPVLDDETEIAVSQTDQAGNEGPATTVISDSTPPDAPEVNPTNGSLLTGSGEPGGTVSVDTDGDGTPDFTAEIGDDGTWSIPLDPAVGDGETISVTQTDSAGNPSPQTDLVVDATADLPPTVDPTNGAAVTGTGVPGSTIEIDTDGDGIPDITGIPVADDGTWTTTIDPQLADGTEISVSQRDDADNVSDATDVTTDSAAPDAPPISPSGGATVFGTGEPGATVNIDIDDDGTPDLTALVGTDGTWSAEISPALSDGDPISATQTDVAGNTSDATDIVVDTAAPPIPVVNPTDGSEISGTGEPGATVTITADGREPITAVVDGDGNWSAEFDPVVPDSTDVSVTPDRCRRE